MIRRIVRTFFINPVECLENMPQLFREYKRERRDIAERKEIREIILKNADALNEKNGDYVRYTEYLKNNTASYFNDEFEKKYEKMCPCVKWDHENCLYYVDCENKGKLYFSSEYNRESMVMSAYSMLCCEQDIDSPHRYVGEGEELEDYIMFDCGSAEGNLSFEHKEKLKHIYLFEADAKWEQALNLTFSEYEEKVTIINKYVSDNNDNHNVSLADYFLELARNKKIDLSRDKFFIKLDIEGAEEVVFKDLLRILPNVSNVKIALCLYHNKDTENIIRGMIPSGYSLEVRDRYMLWKKVDENWEFPFFRHGVMRISKNEAKTDAEQ